MMRHRSSLVRRTTFCCCCCVTALSSLASASKIAVIGGGASGIFAAAHAGIGVTVLEAGRQTLTKVKISGGGRCNVMHDSSKQVAQLLDGYPRGSKEIRGLLTKRFPVTEAANWFQSRGVQLKTEQDGRMFPITDSSQTVIDALMTACEENAVVHTHSKVTSVEKIDNKFQVTYTEKGEGTPIIRKFDAVILATGSAPAGYALVKELDTKFVDTVPSLFTLSTKHATKEGNLFNGLSGVSVPKGRVSFRLKDKKNKWIEQEGPLLITHHGLSGPAALRLSAFGARDFHAANYRGDLKVHWVPDFGNLDDIFDLLWAAKETNPKRKVSSACPLFLNVGDTEQATRTTAIPKRLWSSLAEAAGIEADQVWGQTSKKLMRKLAEQMGACSVEMTGKGTFKEEFVTAGGVSLKAIDMATMQSKACPGLFFCGELINVDGVTGGFNFLNCWSTGYVAGISASEYVKAL